MTMIDSFDPASLEARTDPFESLPLAARRAPDVLRRGVRHVVHLPVRRHLGDDGRHHVRDCTAARSPICGLSQLLVHNHGVVPPNRLEQVAGFPSVDPPDQGALRGLVNQPFRPGAVGRLEDWFRAMVRRELPAVLDQGYFNLTDALGQWSTRTMCRIAGIPQDTGPTGPRSGQRRLRPDRSTLRRVRPDRDDRDLLDCCWATSAQRRAAGADGSLPFIDKAINELVRRTRT